MITDLEVLRSLGILVKDVHGGNYLKGKLLEFSRAYTMYHTSLHRPEWKMGRYRIKEGSNLLDSFEDLDPDVKVFVEMPDNLAKYWDGELQVEPGEYNWRKWDNAKDFEPDTIFIATADGVSKYA